MTLKITKNINEANLITHDGKFHPDDVFSTIFMSKYIENPILCRVPVSSKIETDAIVYDVGFGKFDHHSITSRMRENSPLKYCSFGLLWEEYGRDYLTKEKHEYIEELYTAIEEKLVKQIDGIDNGLFPKIKAPYKILDLDQIIDLYNPTWEENLDSDIYFKRALTMANEIFDNIIHTEAAKIKATKKVLAKIDTVKDNMLILDEYLPYQDAIFTEENPKAKEIKIIIYPSNRGGYCIKPRTINKETKDLLINFPKEYRGIKEDELKKISGIKTAKFVHSSGFLASTENLEDAILLAKKALENKE